jgi:aspartate ammonia-lyase
MKPDNQAIAEAAQRMGIQEEELQRVLLAGSDVPYAAGDYLFHESTPRQWLGFVLAGEVELIQGCQGRITHIGVARTGAMLGEGVMLDDSPHSTSAVTRKGATVWQVSRAALEDVRHETPELFYRLVGQVARRLSDRLRSATLRLAGATETTVLSNVRREHDSLGERDVPAHAYYGIQTLRATENFPFSGVQLRHYEHLIRALACVKKAAAQANADLGALDAGIATAISMACDEILGGKLHDQFVVDMIQGGAGTSTNMNANEVIANRALELLGHPKGRYDLCHPNDHVNCSQSTNDAYPTAVKLGVWFTSRDTLSALRELRTALEAKARSSRTSSRWAAPKTRMPCP